MLNSKYSIMIVDSDLFIAKMLSDFLNENDMKVDIFNDMSLAMKEVTQSVEKYDCIITDLLLPRITGDELIHSIRLENGLIPIILMSAELPSDLAASLRLFDHIYYLKKPFKIDDAIITVKKALNEKTKINNGIS